MELEPVGFVRYREELMISTLDMSFGTNTITFKTTHSDSFRKETTKVRIFILQINNKITNVIKTSEERKIRYVMSLLRKITIKWTIIHTDQYEKTTFSTYQEFKKTFLKRFTNSNLTKTTIKKLLNIRQKKLLIQEYVIRILNLVNKTRLKDQIVRTLIFRRLYYKN